MRKTQLEIADPQAWLGSLEADYSAYSRLVSESKGLFRAAYRVARARCAVETGEAPRLVDMQAAADLIALRLGRHSVLPITSLLPSTYDPSRASSNFPAAPAVQSTRHEVQQVARSLPPPPPSSLQHPKSRPEANRASL